MSASMPRRLQLKPAVAALAVSAVSAVMVVFGGTVSAQDTGVTPRQERPPANAQSPTPPAQNPMVSRPITNENINSAVIRALQELVAVYSAIGVSNDLPNPYKRIEPWAELPAGMKEWGAVIGVEAGPDGNLVVLHRCDENSCVGRTEPPLVKLDAKTGKVVHAWGVGMFADPHGLFVDREGYIWTTDAGRGLGAKLGHDVRKFSPDGKLLMTIGKSGVPGDSPGLLREPTDVVVAPNGDLFITEGHAKLGAFSRISQYSGDGTFIRHLGKTGSGPREVSAPHCITFDSQGRLFICDRDNNRILIWDQKGNYIDDWHQFSRPSGIYIADDDTIYVADSESWGPDNPGWKKGIRIGSARTGQLQYFIEDIESRDYTHSGAEGVGLDLMGNVYGAVVRRRMLERHEPPVPKPSRNAAWGK